VSPAEEISAAAARLRETAERTARAPWSTNGMWVMGADSHIAHFGGHLPNRDWVALVHPGLAEPLASWLESWDGVEIREDGPMPDDFRYALAVARQINRSGS